MAGPLGGCREHSDGAEQVSEYRASRAYLASWVREMARTMDTPRPDQAGWDFLREQLGELASLIEAKGPREVATHVCAQCGARHTVKGMADPLADPSPTSPY